MALDLHLTIPDDSVVAKAVRRIAAAEHISAEEAAMQLLAKAAGLQAQEL